MNWGLLLHWGKRKDLKINLQDMSSPLYVWNVTWLLIVVPMITIKFKIVKILCYINSKFELSKVIEVKSCIKYNVTDWVIVYSLNIASEKALLTYYHCDRMIQLAVAQIYEWI